MWRPRRHARALFCVLLLLGPDSMHAKKKKKKKTRRGELSTYTPLTLQVGVGNQGEQSALKVKLPPESKGVAITSPQQLVKSMGHAWDTVVAPHQAGLADAKAGHVAAVPLSDGEAWHHYQAGQAGVIDSARFLVAFGVVPSLQTGGGKLHAAAARGLLPTVVALLEAGDTEVDAEAEDGSTALHAAAATGHAAVVEALLEAGADPQATGKAGATPLQLAAAMGHEEAVRSHAEAAGEARWWHLKPKPHLHPHPNQVRALLRHGSTLVDQPHAFAQCTALHFASEMGHVPVIRALCEAGADADARKSTGGGAPPP
jgi:hypothetical protein